MTDKLWVGMLRSESKKPPPATNYTKAGAKGKGGTKKKCLQNTYTGSQTEVKEKLLTGPVQAVEEEGSEAAASEHDMSKARQEVEDLQRINAEQQHTISKLASENARLVKQVDLLWQSSPVKGKEGVNGSFEVQVVRNALEQCTREKQMLMNELHRERQNKPTTTPVLNGTRDHSHLIAVLKESLDEKTQQLAALTVQLEDARAEVTRHRSHDTVSEPLVRDTEQLSIRNSELSRDLDIVRLSKASLEKDVQVLQQELAGVNSEYAQLKEYFQQLQEERDALVRKVEVGETQAQLSIDELRVQMDETVMLKTAKIQELLDFALELQDTLATLMKEKDLLTTSLKQEAEYTRQLEEEKNSMERQLSDSNGKLLALEQELQRISDMQDTLEAGQREADEERGALEADLASVTRERNELTSAVGSLQEGLRGTCSEVEQKAQQNRALSATVAQLEKEKGVLEGQMASLRSELTQMESRLAILHHEMGEVQESIKQQARQEVDRVSSQLALTTQHTQQLLSERGTLEGRLHQLERQLSEARHDGDADLDGMRQELQVVTDKLSSTAAELEDWRAANGLLSTQVSELQGQLVDLRGQLRDSTGHAEVVTGTLNQKLAYISQLESIVEEQKVEIQRLNWTVSQSTLQAESSRTDRALRNAKYGLGKESSGGDDCDGSLEISSIDAGDPSYPRGEGSSAPRGDPGQSLSHPQALQRRSTSPNAEAISLRLAESQQQCVKLEAQVASLKTEAAKMQGSIQALTAIKAHLTQHNQALQEANRTLGRERDAMQVEREMVVTEMSRARDTIETLSGEMSTISRSKEELLSEYGEVQTKLAELQEELAEREGEVCALDDQRVAAERELEGATEEVQVLRQKVVSHVESLNLCQAEMEGLQQCVQLEASALEGHAREMDQCVSTLQEDTLLVQEELRVAESVNTVTSARLEENERSVSALMGEVEALRAKRSVILQYVTSQDQQREGQLRDLVARLQEENRELQQRVMSGDGARREAEDELAVLRQSKDEEVSRLLGLLDESRKETSILQEEMGRAPPARKDDELLRTRRKLERLHTKMDGQSRQINYLRIKLGYTLAELRLYKKLKEEMSSQLEQLQAQISLSQEQYKQCLLRLQQAGVAMDAV